MIDVAPVTLAFTGLRAAAADGKLWALRSTSVPGPEGTTQLHEQWRRHAHDSPC